MPMKNAIHSQQVYDPTDESIMAEQLLKEMLAACGAGCWIEPPFHANWGGKHKHLGDFLLR